jgi:UDP-GlcNAc:undecaprenyl-phosphate/decaprenyl-phosphate GlcNAc-1-phosphate transferase
MDAVAFVASAALAAVLVPGALRSFAQAGRTRPNYRGVALPFPAGAIALVIGILAVGAFVAIEHLFETYVVSPDGFHGAIDNHYNADVVALVVGVGFLGLLDDVLDFGARGLRGHARALLRGELSTGVIKAVGTFALAVVVLGRPLHDGEFPPAVAVVVLATNFFNLLDLRPGRAAKVFVLLAATLTVASWDTGPLRVLGSFAGPLVVVGLYDLRERCMLGDTGSNALGMLAGLWLMLTLDRTGEWIAAGVLLALTIFAEFRSISATVDRIPPLRALDSLGRRIDA